MEAADCPTQDCVHMGERSAVRFADEIIVLSENVRQYFLDTYGRATRFVPNGVSAPTLESPRLIAEKWGLQKDSYILYLGRIVPEKGETYLIEAFKRVKTDKKQQHDVFEKSRKYREDIAR